MDESSNTALESRRLKSLRETFRKMLNTVVKGVSFEDFRSHFPALPEDQVRVLYDLFQQVMLNVKDNTEAEFEDIVNEAQLAPRLLDLEALCLERGLVDGIATLPIRPRPTGTSAGAASSSDPVSSTRALAYAAKVREAEDLRRSLAAAEAERQALSLELQAKRAEVLSAAQRLTPLGDQLQGLHQASLAYLQPTSDAHTHSTAPGAAAGGGGPAVTPAPAGPRTIPYGGGGVA